MKITVNDYKDVDIYSKEGFELLSELWLKVYAHNKLTHQVSWMGIPIIQVAEDVIMMQELIWKVKPDVIIECGVAHGGSLIFYSSLLELIGNGKVIGVDVEIRPHNRVAIENHPMAKRVTLIEGSSISMETLRKVETLIQPNEKIMVVLDSNHSTEHVTRELELYHKFVTPGSYIVAMDGAQAFVWDIPNGKKEWKTDNPLVAIESFMKDNTMFEIDEHYTRLKVTANPKGFLKRVK